MSLRVGAAHFKLLSSVAIAAAWQSFCVTSTRKGGAYERNGECGGYVLGLLFLPIIFYPMLAFGDAEYQGPSA
jgi:hypothetical protein